MNAGGRVSLQGKDTTLKKVEGAETVSTPKVGNAGVEILSLQTSGNAIGKKSYIYIYIYLFSCRLVLLLSRLFSSLLAAHTTPSLECRGKKLHIFIHVYILFITTTKPILFKFL